LGIDEKDVMSYILNSDLTFEQLLLLQEIIADIEKHTSYSSRVYIYFFVG
jgi:hypothetical protein